MIKLVTPETDPGKETLQTLDEIARQGAKRMLAEALELEVAEYLTSNKESRDESGHRMVVGNGRGKARKVLLGSGEIEIEAPRVNDKRMGEKFSSIILPAYLRKSPNVESVLPILYLKGLSTNAFQSALSQLFGDGVRGLSPSSIVALKKSWEREFEVWRKRRITEQYVYIWADGVNVKVRLGEDKKICLLVIIGVTIDGKKELLAVEPGYRESKESWKLVLDGLRSRGMIAPLLAIGDGALGFWAALRDAVGFQQTQEQRCWVHKIANVLDALPKRLHPQAKILLHDMMYAETASQADEEKKRFENAFGIKYPKAAEKINKSWNELTTFYSYPAHQWKHIRSTNVIESSFATVKLRTRATKGAGSPNAAAMMAFKLLSEAQKRWRTIDAPQELRNLISGVEYKDGNMVSTPNTQEAAAC